ncbi:MAG: 23S rRNA (adenine(2503)-C(2))-methyltransferase RlmN [Phycisphaerales bacterium]|jgi:23S rRNA (adenine2503-C2)-methyltransferase|nr:23S rRNA (adenine(2503)-C(2))-methyltransferase RlmN [Phycisphaerales bacterium]
MVRPTTVPSLCDHTLDSLAQQLLDWDEPASHAPRLLRAFYQSHGHPDWSTQPISRKLQHRLATDVAPRSSKLLTTHTSADGTQKLLLSFDTGTVESVLMPGHRPGVAAGCISSQIGCAMGCDFCASTRDGFVANLTAGQIIDQFLHLRHHAAAIGRRLQTVVFMGMGEPMLNLPAVIEAIARMTHSSMGNLGAGRITVSTVGIVPGIDALAACGHKVQLALSLHAPDDPTRARLVPMNRRYGIDEIMAAAKRYQQRTGRFVNIEYCLLNEINDSPDHARQLARLMEGFRAHVNIIPYNPIGPSLSGVNYQRPTPQRLEQFVQILRDHAVVTHTRHPRGDQINAACGQLRRQSITTPAVADGPAVPMAQSRPTGPARESVQS